jgi:hypothetical protein
MSAARSGRRRIGTRRAPRALLAFGLVLALASPGAQAATASDIGHGFAKIGEDAFDLVVLRPSGMVALAAGSIFFAATVPFVTPYHAVKGTVDGVRASYEVFVYPPYEYTFERDLGDF